MARPVPSPINRIAQGVVTELCVARGQLVGFVENDWLEKRIARLIRDTILTEHERCANVVATRVTGFDYVPQEQQKALRIALAKAIRDLPIAS